MKGQNINKYQQKELNLMCNTSKGLFTRSKGAPANQATWLEGLTHSPPSHVTHLTGTVSGLRGLSFEQLLSTTNKMADQGNFLVASLIFLSRFLLAAAFQCIGLLFCTLLIQHKKNSSRVAMFLWFISPQLGRIARHEPFTW